MSHPLLEVRDLRAGYGGTPILQGVDLHVNQGEIVAIIGRNGVGKTTLMKSVIGLIPTTAGVVLYQREDITALQADRRAHLGMGYIPQGRGIFARLSVGENLMMGRLINTKKTQKLDTLVDRYFPILRERRNQKAGTLSGGEQQQLAIGRALEIGRASCGESV